MKELLKQSITNITSENWMNNIKHVGIELKIWKLDNVKEIHVEPQIITSGSDSLSSSSDKYD